MTGKDGGWLLPETIDPPRRSFCIAIPDEPAHVAAFFGALRSLGIWLNWQRDPAHTAALVAEVWRTVAENAHTAFYEQECQMFLLRQNPDDACLLEQSVDGGGTWTEAFDFGKCIPPATQTILDQVGSLYNNGWQASPYAPTDTWTHSDGDTSARSEQRAAALCYAAKITVELACESYIAGLDLAYTLTTLAQVATAIGAPFAAILTGPVITGMLVAFMEIALAEVQNSIEGDREVLTDPNIRAWLACTLYQQMSGRPVTENSFGSAFDEDFTCRSTDEQRAASIMDALFSNPEPQARYFKAFSDLVAEALLAEQSNLLDTCSCPTATWTYCLPLDRWWSWSERIDPFEYRCDHLVSGVPEASELIDLDGSPVWNCGASSGYRALARMIHFYVPSTTTITEVHFSQIATLGTPIDDGYWKQIRANDECFGCSSCFGAPITLTGLSISGSDLNLMVTILNGGGLTDNMGISQIKISGTGVPMFGGCNC